MNLKLYELLSSEERVKIVGEVLFLEKAKVGEIAKELELSKGLVSKYFEILVRNGILRREENDFFLIENSKTRALRILFNVMQFPEKIFSKWKFVESAGLYGSAARGENDRDSDFDVWIKISNAKEEEIAKVHSELGNKIEKLNLLVLDEKKIEEMKKKDSMFYHSIFFGSIVLYGERNEK